MERLASIKLLASNVYVLPDIMDEHAPTTKMTVFRLHASTKVCAVTIRDVDITRVSVLRPTQGKDVNQGWNQFRLVI